MRRLALIPLLAFAPLVVLPACMDDSNPGPLTAPPATGSLEIVTVTTGDNIDSDGYVCGMDFQVFDPMGVNETAILTGLPVGDHTVLLADIADNCEVSGFNPRRVSVVADQTVRTTFEIACS